LTDASLSSGNQNESTAKTGSGRGWHGNAAGHAVAGRKGGSKVAQDREHMAEIGRRGGSKVAQDREHMAEIGRRGGSKVAQDREHMAEIGQKGGKAKGSKES
jgi:general stress protein YciG